MRGLFGQRDRITVYCPIEILDNLRDGLSGFEKIQGYDFNVTLIGLKPGDEVVTTGGIIGRIKSVSDEFVTLDVGSSSLKLTKESITRATKKNKK